MKFNNKIIFVIGNSRSGTTMLSRILNNHTKIRSFNELHFFNDIINEPLNKIINYKRALVIANKILNRIYNDVWSKINDTNYSKLSHKILKNIDKDSLTSFIVFNSVMYYFTQKNNLIYVLEQTPKNILYFDDIINVYPNAKFIHMIRDPRAVLASQKNRWKKYQRKADKVPLYNIFRVFINYHLFTTLKVWKLSIKKGISLRKYEKNYYEIKFENLILNSELELNKLLKYLKLDNQSNLTNVPQIGSSNLEHKKNKFGLNDSVLTNWKSIINKAENYVCNKYLSKEMKMFNYEIIGTKFQIYILKYILTYPIHVLGVVLINPRLLYRSIKKILN